MNIFLILLVTGSVSSLTLSETRDACENVWCKAGRECVVSGGKGECRCITTCPDHFKPVCGSDGQSYNSHCKLHQQACISNRHIRIEHKGLCKNKSFSKKMKKDHDKIRKLRLQHELANDLARDILNAEKKHQNKKDEDPLPAVCYSPQRDALRFLLVEHWEETLKNQSWYRSGMTFRDNLWGRFFSCDSDKNNYLTPQELVGCSTDVPFLARPGQDSKTTKALCIDALVDDGDNSRDYRLDFEEFAGALNPDYKPKMKKCNLEGKKFVDGDEVHLDCNHCICAVGKWVCAASTCKNDKERGTRIHHTNVISNYLEKESDENSYAQFDVKPLKPTKKMQASNHHKYDSKHKHPNEKNKRKQFAGVEKTLRGIQKFKSSQKLKKYWQKQLFEKPGANKFHKFSKYDKKHHKKHHNKKYLQKF